MGKSLSEKQVEQAALGWCEALGYDVRKGVLFEQAGSEQFDVMGQVNAFKGDFYV